MASLPVIFDISSDDESVTDEIGGIEDFDRAEPKSNDEDWLLKLLEVADKHSDDSDEVVVVAEFNPTKKISKSKSCKTTLKYSDDDCVILNGDPDNSVASLNDSADGSDEILIVAEKGQIACRDYPHPRHLCARFPFISTPHEKHCDLCHCYVCDTIAPCSFWHGGLSLVEHCHATDKEAMWKEQRISFRKENQGSISIALPEVNQSLHQDTIQITKNSRAGCCFSPTNQISQSTKFQHCSSNNIAASTIRNHGVHQLSATPENIFQLTQASHHQLGVENPSIPRAVRKLTQRDKGNGFSSLPSKFVTSSTMFKRTGAVGGAAQFNRFLSYRNNSTNTSQYVMNPPSVAPHLSTVSGFGDPSGWHDSLQSVITRSYSENAVRSGCPSLVETNGHSIPPINGRQISHQHQNQSDNSNWSSVQPENPIQSANKNIYQQGNPNQICQLEISSECPNHNSFEHGNEIKDASDGAPDLSFHWSSDYSLNNQPSPSGSCQIIVSESRHVHLAVKESDSDLTGNVHAPVNVKHDNCFMENQSVPPGQDWLCGLSILSPPPSSIDTDMIVFDFETSWNGITEV